jgi:hypothetical protein
MVSRQFDRILLQSRKDYYQDNTDEIKQSRKIYYQENKEKIKEKKCSTETRMSLWWKLYI